jgi:hypothetical protein
MTNIAFIYSKSTYAEKPQGRLITLLQKPENYTFANHTIAEIARLISEGRAWRAGIYDKGTPSFKKTNAKHAQIVALDFDGASHSPEEVAEYAENIGLPASLYYYSYSQGIKPGYNFRLLWMLAEPITAVQYERIYPALLDTFANFNPDRATKDCSRLWYGSSKQPEVLSRDALPLSTLGWLSVLRKSEEEGITTAYTLRNNKNNLGEDYFAEPLPETAYITVAWWEQLRTRCRLWDKWEKGEYLHYAERLVLFTNLKYLAYGDTSKSIYTDILQFYNPATYAGHTCDERQIREMLGNRTLRPKPCVMDGGEELTAPAFFHRQATGKVGIINDSPKITLEELDEALDTNIPELLSNEGIGYIESQTASGKTHRIIRWMMEQDLTKIKVIYSAPTYIVIDEFLQRFESAFNFRRNKVATAFGEETAFSVVGEKNPITVIPQGNYTQHDLLRLELGLPARTPQNERFRAIRAMMDYEEKGVFVCSHQLIAHLREINADLIIIDEDISDALEDIVIFNKKGLSGLVAYLSEDSDRQKVLGLIDSLEGKNWGQPIDITPLREAIDNSFDWEGYLSAGAVMAGLAKIGQEGISPKVNRANKEPAIRLRTKSNLVIRAIDKQIPVKIFSATPKYRKLLSLYGIADSVITHYDFPYARLKGTVIQDLGMTGAKGNNADKIPDLIAYIKRKVPPEVLENAYVLSFKDAIPIWLAEGFQVPIGEKGEYLHLANCAGVDSLKGKSLIVAGKYDVNDSVYIDTYFDLHPDRTELPTKKNFVRVINGKTVKIFLWEDETLQQIQLDNLRHSAEQATGRARALRMAGAKVYIFNNYPISEAQVFV